METIKSRLIEWAIASQTLSGQGTSGDLGLVKLLPEGALVAVVDGLGHGEEAAAAAKIAIDTLVARAGESLIDLVNHCHEALRRTRGVVMSLASFNSRDNTMTWLGVGNVEGFLLHPSASSGQESLLVRGGLVGDQLPHLSASTLLVTKGDVLILATDGVRPDFVRNVILTETPQQIADRIMAWHSRGTDDALVLVASYVYE
jgi:serine/threonine protein phosphatase PrpC